MFEFAEEAFARDGSGCYHKPSSPISIPLDHMGDMVTYFVLTISNGANASPASAAAPIAIPKLLHGYGLSTTSSPAANPPANPGSGALSTADRKLRAQFSTVRSKAAYTNVAFVPFHTPQTPSLVHRAPMTSRTESERLSASWCGAAGSEGSGRT